MKHGYNDLNTLGLTIQDLPDEIMLLLFSFLDDPALRQIRLTCSQWNTFAEDRSLWNERFSWYFDQSVLESDPVDHPKKAYCQQYLRYKTLKQKLNIPFGMPTLLSSLNGHIVSGEKVLQQLAISNGHDSSLDALRREEEINALIFAAQVGNVSVVKTLFLKIKPTITEATLVLNFAAEKDQLAVAKFILQAEPNIEAHSKSYIKARSILKRRQRIVELFADIYPKSVFESMMVWEMANDYKPSLEKVSNIDKKTSVEAEQSTRNNEILNRLNNLKKNDLLLNNLQQVELQLRIGT